MELSYPSEDYSKSSSEETDDMGTGRSYECVFCKRGFTTAQALGGHMNIHRKDRANNKSKPNFPPSSSSKLTDHGNYADLGFYSPIPTHLVAGGNNNNNYCYSTTAPEYHDVDTNNNYHQFYFPSQACGTRPSSNLENQRNHRHLFGQDWRQSLNLYTNPDKIEDNNNEEGGLDLELRLGHHP